MLCQAEDGIRDLTVTGVQTCALPIFKGNTSFRRWRLFWPLAPHELLIEQQIVGNFERAGDKERQADQGMPGKQESRKKRSEERRVGREGRTRWSPDHLKKKKNKNSGS